MTAKTGIASNSKAKKRKKGKKKNLIGNLHGRVFFFILCRSNLLGHLIQGCIRPLLVLFLSYSLSFFSLSFSSLFFLSHNAPNLPSNRPFQYSPTEQVSQHTTEVIVLNERMEAKEPVAQGLKFLPHQQMSRAQLNTLRCNCNF